MYPTHAPPSPTRTNVRGIKQHADEASAAIRLAPDSHVSGSPLNPWPAALLELRFADLMLIVPPRYAGVGLVAAGTGRPTLMMASKKSCGRSQRELKKIAVTLTAIATMAQTG